MFDINQFNKVEAQIKALHSEISSLAKKNPNDGINVFKLRFINAAITEANAILDTDYHPFRGFENFDENALPTTSDVVLILAQYMSCFRREYQDKKLWMTNL